jgi:hypothetical protein
MWLTVPVVFRGRLGQQIIDVEIRESDFWREHLRSIEFNYRRAPFFDKYYPAFRELIGRVAAPMRLAELNAALLQWLADAVAIETPILRCSELAVTGKRTHLLGDICACCGATTYISPLGSADYLLGELSILTDQGVEVFFQHYEHPEYHQLFPPFQAFASVLDLLFNEGDNSLAILRKGRRELFVPAEVAALTERQADRQSDRRIGA